MLTSSRFIGSYINTAALLPDQPVATWLYSHTGHLTGGTTTKVSLLAGSYILCPYYSYMKHESYYCYMYDVKWILTLNIHNLYTHMIINYAKENPVLQIFRLNNFVQALAVFTKFNHLEL